MARTCGIRIGPRRFEIVVLDGSPKKHRIVAYKSGEFPTGGADPEGDVVATLKAAASELKVPEDAIAIAVDTGTAAFRTLKLPSLDESKVDEIIKFEVEGQLPQWNIDDIIVTFLTLDRTDKETSLLVTAVPKATLRREIDACTKAGIEPLEAELEAAAMVNAALASGVCRVDEAQVLVHIGDTSTAVVLIDGGKVRQMRAIHIGALTHEPVAAPSGDAPPAEDSTEPAPPPPPADPIEAQRRQEQAVSRIRRELGRTLSGARTAHPLKAVYICGWEVPNLVGTQVLDTPVYELDAFVEESGKPVEGAAPLVVAYGAALGMLGGGAIRSSLRREELKYTGTFERLELPIAVAVMLAVMWLLVFNLFESDRLAAADSSMFRWLQSNKNFLVNDPKAGKRGNLQKPWPELQRLVEDASRKDNPLLASNQWSRLDQLRQIERALLLRQDKLNKELGNTGEVKQPQSVLEALTLVTNTMVDMGDALGRISIRTINANYVPARTGTNDLVTITLSLSFHNDEGAIAATRSFEALKTELERQPWVTEVAARNSKEFPDGKGIYSDGYTITCDLSKAAPASAKKEGS
ncbi:MAG: hypothetical protein FJ294_00400 [Planctomycetes bacterium]|nr:hypothetical protein [Planctomycetota bacterium]